MCLTLLTINRNHHRNTYRLQQLCAHKPSSISILRPVIDSIKEAIKLFFFRDQDSADNPSDQQQWRPRFKFRITESINSMLIICDFASTSKPEKVSHTVRELLLSLARTHTLFGWLRAEHRFIQYRSQWSSGRRSDCSARGPGIKSRCGQLCLSHNHCDLQPWARAVCTFPAVPRLTQPSTLRGMVNE